MTPITYFIRLVADAVNALKGLSLAPLGLPNLTMFDAQIALLVAFTLLAMLGKDENDDD